MSFEKILTNLTYNKYEQFIAERTTDGMQPVESEGDVAQSDDAQGHRQKLFGSFMEFVKYEVSKYSCPSAADASFTQLIDKIRENRSVMIRAQLNQLSIEEPGNEEQVKRRYLLWNPGNIHEAEDGKHLRKALIELIDEIKPDGILINELRLRNEENLSKEELKKKLDSQMELLIGVGYSVMSIVSSNKEQKANTKKASSTSHWKGGTAIFIRKDKIADKDRQIFTTGVEINKVDYEITSVYDDSLKVTVFCCYAHEHFYNTDVANYFKNISECVGGGDVNMQSATNISFNKKYSNMKSCMNDTWNTHKYRSTSDENLIDFVFKDKNDNRILVKVHEPFTPNSYGCGHYPIVFDVIKINEGNADVSTDEKQYCTDPKCEFLCGRRIFAE